MFWYWIVWQSQIGPYTGLNRWTIDNLLDARLYKCLDVGLFED